MVDLLCRQANCVNGFELALQPQMLELALDGKKLQIVFVNSMSDLFHMKVPLDYIRRVFDLMKRAHWHRFHALTKWADGLRGRNQPGEKEPRQRREER